MNKWETTIETVSKGFFTLPKSAIAAPLVQKEEHEKIGDNYRNCIIRVLPCQNQQPQHLWLFPKVLHHPQHPFSPKQSRQNKKSIFAEYMFNNFP